MIKLENTTKSYGVKLLFSDISFHFPEQEKIALLGANGTGKSTLLRIIVGEEESDGGTVHIPSRCSLGYLPQEPNPSPKPTVLEECLCGAEIIRKIKEKMDAALEKMTDNPSEDNVDEYSDLEAQFSKEGGYALESEAQKILMGLGFSDAYVADSPLNLSGGWRMRLELAKLFLNKPDFLILDEPTNHLDLPSLVWVEKYLKEFKGTLLFVSHDRSLLNRLATMCLEISKSTFYSYKGNFDKFVEQKQLRLEQAQATRDQLQRKKKDLQSFVDRFGAKASKAKQAQSRVKMLQRLSAVEDGIEKEERLTSMSMKLPPAVKSGRTVLDIKDLTTGYESLKLASNINVQVERQMKIAVIGANGVGKSTFLKTICDHIPMLAGSVTRGHNVKQSYFAQDQLDVLDPNRSCLENLLDTKLGEREARSLLGHFLFRGDDVFKPVKVLSGGEKSRVGLAYTLANAANFYILDEPTNHLDMQSVEVLAQALSEYDGTLLFVSHDREFINQVCTHIFAMYPDGSSGLFEGDLSDYQKLTKIAGMPNVLEANAEPKPEKKKVKAEDPRDIEKKRKKQIKKVETDLKKVEQQMENIKVKYDLEVVSEYLAFEKENDILEKQKQQLEDQWLKLNES